MQLDELIRDWSRVQTGLVSRPQVIVAAMMIESFDSPDPIARPSTLPAAWALARTASPQLVARVQSFAARRVRNGQWQRPAPGVFGDPWRGTSFDRRMWAAVLQAGPHAVAASDGAARWWSITGAKEAAPHVLLPHPHHVKLVDGRAHQTRRWDPTQHATERGLPITTVARTIVDLSLTWQAALLEQAMDDALARRTVTVAAIGAAFATFPTAGRKGLGTIGRLLDARASGYIPPASELERMLLAALAAVGLPPPARQHPFPGPRSVGTFVDAAYPDALLLLEADGRTWHQRIRQMAHDRERDAEAARRGWLTVRLGWEGLADDPLPVANRIADIRATRLHQLVA